MEIIGISETGLIDKKIEFERSLGKKILLGVHICVHICTLGVGTAIFFLGYGIYTLSNFVLNKFNDERKFNQFINEKKEYVETLMKSYLNSIEKNIKKFKELSIENAKRLLGLLKASSIEVDDFWRKAKDEYIMIFDMYKKINPIKS